MRFTAIHTLATVLLAALSLAPGPSRGGWIGLRNDTGSVLVVQRASVINNVVCPNRPLVLYPGEVAWDSVVQPCVKIITIAHPNQPKMPLSENKIRCGSSDLFYAVRITAGELKLEATTPPMGGSRSASR